MKIYPPLRVCHIVTPILPCPLRTKMPINNIILSVPDMNDPGAWYYLDMTEAANSHNYTVSDGAEKWK